MVAKQELNNNEILVKEKLWTWNFFLLWQGQLVSALGDVAYGIALGFWVLQKTGSTALMGTLMACSTIPRLIISPFAGVYIDRANRRNIIVAADVIRGVLVTLVAIAAFAGYAQVWMVFVTAIMSGAAAAFFNPAVGSAIPDLVDKSKLMKANSVFSMIYSGSNIVGNSIGGVLYNFLGAPIMFLFNGISYLFSAVTEIFIKIPRVERPAVEQHFWVDMKEGYTFVWKFRGLRDLISIAAMLNLFANMAMVLFLPLFYKTEALGPVKYGLAMAAMTAGMFIGMLFTSIVNIPTSKKMPILLVGCFTFSILLAVLPFINNIITMMVLLFISGLSNSIFNAIINVSVVLSIPQNMRGKVSSLMQTVTMGLTPIGYAAGGILAEYIPIRYVISGCFVITILLFIPFAFMKHFRRFINFDPNKQTLEDIL